MIISTVHLRFTFPQNSRQKAKSQLATRPHSSNDNHHPAMQSSNGRAPELNHAVPISNGQYSQGVATRPYASPYASNPLSTSRPPSRSQQAHQQGYPPQHQQQQWAPQPQIPVQRSHTPGPLFNTQVSRGPGPIPRSATSFSIRTPNQQQIPAVPNRYGSSTPYASYAIPEQPSNQTQTESRRRQTSFSQAQAPHSSSQPLRSQTYDPLAGRGSPMLVDAKPPRYDPVRSAGSERSKTPFRNPINDQGNAPPIPTNQGRARYDPVRDAQNERSQTPAPGGLRRLFSTKR